VLSALQLCSELLLFPVNRMLFAVLALVPAVLAFAPASPVVPTRQPLARVDLIAQADKTYSGEASNRFNNVRTPAALVAGAAFGAVFALQPSPADRAVVSLAKRMHMLIGVGAFCSELIAVLVASVSLGKLGMSQTDSTLTEAAPANVFEFIEREYELEWVATQFNFIVGLLGLGTMVGIRAWVAFSCPLFGRIAVGFVTSAILTMLSFASEAGDRSVMRLGVRYVALLFSKAVRERSIVLTAALAVGLASTGFMAEAMYTMAVGSRCPVSGLTP
jgi:hypothetical protein